MEDSNTWFSSGLFVSTNESLLNLVSDVKL